MSRRWRAGIADVKDPDDVDRIVFDWSAWLLGAEAIASSAWAVDAGTDDALTLASDSIAAGTTIVYWAGGTAGVSYTVRNRIVTTATIPRTKDRSVVVRTREE